MTEYLLDVELLGTALLAFAVATPLLAFAVYKWKPRLLPFRMAMVCGAFGPFAFLFWQFHNAILSVTGFDSIISAAILMSVASVCGIAAGLWAGKGHAPSRRKNDSENTQ